MKCARASWSEGEGEGVCAQVAQELARRAVFLAARNVPAAGQAAPDGGSPRCQTSTACPSNLHARPKAPAMQPCSHAAIAAAVALTACPPFRVAILPRCSGQARPSPAALPRRGACCFCLHVFSSLSANRVRAPLGCKRPSQRWPTARHSRHQLRLSLVVIHRSETIALSVNVASSQRRVSLSDLSTISAWIPAAAPHQHEQILLLP